MRDDCRREPRVVRERQRADLEFYGTHAVEVVVPPVSLPRVEGRVRCPHRGGECFVDHSKWQSSRRRWGRFALAGVGIRIGNVRPVCAHIMLLSSVGGTSTDDALVASEGATTATITTVTTVLTDGDTDVLKLLRVNAKNNVRCIDDGNGDDDGDESCDDAKGSSSLTCRQLLWGEERAMEFLRAEAQRRRNRDRRHRRRPHRKSSSSSSAATRRRRRSRSAPGRLSYSPEPRPRAT